MHSSLLVRPKDITFVVHGLFEGSHPSNPASVTNKLFASIYRYFPGSQIIFATWSNYPYIEFMDSLPPFVRIALATDPGAPPLITLSGSPLIHSNNINRHIVSCQAGLSCVETTYTCRMRPDFIFTNDNLVRLYSRILSSMRSSDLLFSAPILATTHGTVTTKRRLNHARYPYHPSDMLQLGKTEDIASLWGQDLMPDDDFSFFLHNSRQVDKHTSRYSHYYLCRYLPEQYLFTSFLLKRGFLAEDEFIHMYHRPSAHYGRSEDLIRSNFRFAGFRQLGVYWNKPSNPYLLPVPFFRNRTIYIGSLRHHFSKYFPSCNSTAVGSCCSWFLLSMLYLFDSLLAFLLYALQHSHVGKCVRKRHFL
jgi:hypothetical protein